MKFAETALFAGHAEVGDHRQSQSAADRGAMNRRDDRLFGAKQPVAFDIKMRRARPRPAQKFVAVAIAFAEICAGAKRLALRGQNQRAAPGVGVQILERGGNLADQRGVEEIIRRPPDLDQCDVAALFDADILKRGHANGLRFHVTRVVKFGRAVAAFGDQRVHHR